MDRPRSLASAAFPLSTALAHCWATQSKLDRGRALGGAEEPLDADGELLGVAVFGLGQSSDVAAGDRAGGERRGDRLVGLAEDGGADEHLGAGSGDLDLPHQPAHRRALPVGLPAAGEIPPAQGADELGLGPLSQ